MGVANDMKKLSEDIITSYDLRVSFITDLSKNVDDLIKAFQKEHTELSAKIKEDSAKIKNDLLRGEEERLNDYRTMMDSTQASIAGIRADVESKLKEFHKVHARMSKSQQKELARYMKGIVRETGKILDSFKAEREKMASSWQSLTVTMAKKRAGKPVSVGEKVNNAAEVLKKKPVEKPAPAAKEENEI